ncbi:uncharacterized protein [Miscanthus floridulus]|uniref:uncharacterized protein n=1 Tax=Miscanthus floridulus TaxID=154761 RepID=UPI003458B053
MSLPLPTVTTQPAVTPTAPPSSMNSAISDAMVSSGAPLTLHVLASVVVDIQREMREMRAAWNGLVQQPQPPLFPAPPHLPPPTSSTPTPSAPVVSYPYGMPHSGSSVPLHQLQWPNSPSSLPAWLQAQMAASAPIYSTAVSSTPATPAPSSTIAASSLPPTGDIFYGGVDGPLFQGAPPPSAGQYTGMVDPGLAAALALGGAHAGPKFYKLEFPTFDGSVDPLN